MTKSSVEGALPISEFAPVLSAADVGIDEALTGAEGSRIQVEKVFLPPEGEGAEIIKGSVEDAAARLAEILREKGGIV